MKNLIVVFYLVLTYSSITLAQNFWEWISPYPSGNIPEYSYERDGHIFYFGFPKSFFLTTDGGQNFIIRSPYKKITDTHPSYTDRIAFADSLIGVITDDDGIYRTTNAGKIWFTLVDYPGHNMGLVSFGDNKVGWLIGAGIKKTLNAGVSWDYVYSTGLFEEGMGPFSRIFSLNKDSLWVCTDFNYRSGGRIYFSSNGGLNWTKRNVIVSDSLHQVFYNDIRFSKSGNGIVVGRRYLIGENIWETLLFKTKDFGESWERVFYDSLILRKIVARGDEDWLIVGDKEIFDPNSRTIPIRLKTTDAGNTWKYMEGFNSTGSYYYDSPTTAEYTSNEDVIIVSLYSGLYKSTDFGDTFSRLSNEKEISVRGFAIEKNPVNEYQIVVAVSDGDSLIVSNDGGNNWTKKFLPNEMGDITNDGVYVSDGIIYLITLGYNIYKSSDLGETWEDLYHGYSGVRDVTSYDRNNIAFNSYVGFTPTLNYTSDAGNSWIHTPRNNGFANDMQMPKPGEIYSCGEFYDSIYFGYIYHSYDGGYNWKVIDTKREVNQICFLDNKNVIAISNYEVYKTFDGGDSWRIIRSSNDYYEYFNRLAFIDSINGIMKISYKFFESHNGGTNWNESQTFLPIWGGLTKLEFNNQGDLFLLGEGNLCVLRNVYQQYLENQNTSNLQFKNENLLFNNYPNPFNSITKIRYFIPQKSNVVLKIYDILGNEVAILVNEEKAPGVYEVEFNSVGTSRDLSLPSGVYFYQLKSDSFVESKKMLLLK